MNEELVRELETPCIVIDTVQAEKNIREMQDAVEKYCMLRPHIKTHKMEYFLKRQLEAGANGISCAKISEAEIMAKCGAKDIFIAYPMVGDFRIKRALKLNKEVERLILAVDSKEAAYNLNKMASDEKEILEIRMEIDTGVGRTGISADAAIDLAEYISTLSNLRLTGIYTFKSLVYKGLPTVDKYEASKEEALMMDELCNKLKNKGFDLEISAGSTPTGFEVARTGKIDEVRPGTYVFYDYMMHKEGACEKNQIACRFYATIISVHENYAVIDGGTKTFPMDIILDEAPYFYESYAIVEGNEDLKLRRMYEEHGIITSSGSSINLKVGDKISLIPIHICTAINMQNHVYLYDGKNVMKEPVLARGMLV